MSAKTLELKKVEISKDEMDDIISRFIDLYEYSCSAWNTAFSIHNLLHVAMVASGHWPDADSIVDTLYDREDLKEYETDLNPIVFDEDVEFVSRVIQYGACAILEEFEGDIDYAKVMPQVLKIVFAALDGNPLLDPIKKVDVYADAVLEICSRDDIDDIGDITEELYEIEDDLGIAMKDLPKSSDFNFEMRMNKDYQY